MSRKKQAEYKKRSQLSIIWNRLRKNKLAMLGLAILVVMVALAVCADWIADYDTNVTGMNMAERLQTPSAKHWFGTDSYGRDVFARIIHGSRLSLSLSIFAMLAAVAIGSIIGAIAGYYGGRVDDVLMRLMDILLAIPPMLMSISIVAALGHSMVNLMIALSLAYIPVFARVIRSSILTVKGQEFIEAAKACGTSNARIILRHIIPNAIGPIIVQATLAMGSTILIISSLSFMGMGIQPPQPEWGTMLYEGRDLIRTSPYLVIFPGIAIALAVLSLNLLGDG
ncbi:MAG: ABC transporter permease, partial [Christensenellales bacterium]|nr:ABC transporter permease [Christensenellales bacterium]